MNTQTPRTAAAQNAVATPSTQATALPKTARRSPAPKNRSRLWAGLGSVLVSTVLLGSVAGGFHGLASDASQMALAVERAAVTQQA